MNSHRYARGVILSVRAVDYSSDHQHTVRRHRQHAAGNRALAVGWTF